MIDSTIIRAHPSAAGAKRGMVTKLWADHQGALEPSST
jgi:hypothetical protein